MDAKMPLLKLRRLRKDVETEAGELSVDQAYLLLDVCQALGLNENETEYVLGKRIMAFFNSRIRHSDNGRLGPPGAGQETVKSPNECIYCERPALAPGFQKPPMCEKHLVISVIVQYLRNHGLPINLETVSLFVTEHPQADIHPDDVKTLLTPVLEADYATE